nr:macro domain-containing protein [uncultured Desulfobacter sp.]
MLNYKIGDLFKEDAEAIVNTVNCVGAMGRGIALQFKKAYPANYKAYASACKHKQVVPGKMFVFETGGMLNPQFIINFPTKRHWRGKSRIEDVESGLQDLRAVIERHNIRSIAIPPLGSGLGGLNWSEVRERIERALSNLENVKVVIFEPIGAPDAKAMVRNKQVPKMTEGRAALVELINRYLAGLLDPFISLLEIHKLMYFLQESGEPLRLQYEKAPYGPYAKNLRHVLNAIEGHLITGYADGGDDPNKPLELIPGASEDAKKFLKVKKTTLKRFEKVSKLVEGFESQFGLELLSTVHWVIEKEKANSPQDVMEKIYGWNNRKKQFTTRQISIAIKTLSKHGWIQESSFAI